MSGVTTTCAELSGFYRLIEPLPGRGGSRHYARYYRGDRGILGSRSSPRISGQAGFFGPPTLRLRPRVSSVPIAGPGATVGPVETRVPWAGLPQPSTLCRGFC